MGVLVPVALFGWPFVVMALFLLVKPRKAVLAGYIGAWLFLPMAGYQVPGFPNYTKVFATTLGVILGVVIFDSQRFLKFRPHWIDLPMLVFCLWPMASSLATGKGAYDGVSAIVQQIIFWGMPYFFGRIYIADFVALRELAVAIVIGGLIYVPLCLIEIRLSPQLHTWVYGYHQHNFAQSLRYGGFRPTVFMQHGLAVGMWMISASLLAVWLWSTATVRQLFGLPISWLLPPLLVTTVLVKSFGALLLMAFGLLVLFTARAMGRSWPLWLLISAPPVWMLGRYFGGIDSQLLQHFSDLIPPDRAHSFEVRLDQENEIMDLAMRRPITGGSRWWDTGADQLWLLTFRSYGVIGLTAMTAVLLLPSAVILTRIPFRKLLQPEYTSAVGLSLIVVLSMIDNLLNAMINPVFVLAAGGLAAVATRSSRVALSAKRRTNDSAKGRGSTRPTQSTSTLAGDT